MKRSLLLLLSVVLLNAPFVIEAEPSAEGDSEWLQWSSSEQAGFNAGRLDAVRQRADEQKSAAVMAIYRGHVLVAWGDVDRKLELHSVRKSLYSALWGIAIDRDLADPDTTLAELGIDDLRSLSAREKNARIADLLAARSGVYHTAAYTTFVDQAQRPERNSYAPGEHFHYNNWDFNVAGGLLERITGQPIGVLFDEWIADPIGMTDFEPNDVFEVLEPRVSKWPALTFRMSTRDLARFGTLWLNRGAWSRRQIIPAEWVDRASSSISDFGEGRGYGMMWWTYEPGSISAEDYPTLSRYRIVQARGTGGQAVFVIPAAEMVIVHRADTDHAQNVPGTAVWTIADRIVGAQTGEPAEDPIFVKLDPVPFDSQLPELEWPEPVSLDRSELEVLVGHYRFDAGFGGEVFLHDGRLFGFLEGQGEAEFFPVSSTDFVLRVMPSASIRFVLDESGRAEEMIITMGGRPLRGQRVDESRP